MKCAEYEFVFDIAHPCHVYFFMYIYECVYGDH